MRALNIRAFGCKGKRGYKLQLKDVQTLLAVFIFGTAD